MRTSTHLSLKALFALGVLFAAASVLEPAEFGFAQEAGSGEIINTATGATLETETGSLLETGTGSVETATGSVTEPEEEEVLPTIQQPLTSQERLRLRIKRRTQNNARLQQLLDRRAERQRDRLFRQPGYLRTSSPPINPLTFENRVLTGASLSMQMRSISFEDRLICRVRNRYVSPHASETLKNRLVQRIANQQGMPRNIVEQVLNDDQYCETLWSYNTKPTEKEEIQPEEEAPNLKDIPKEMHYPYLKTNGALTSETPNKEAAPAKQEKPMKQEMKEKKEMQKEEEKEQQSATGVLNSSQKLDKLCRIQERIDRSGKNKKKQIREAAASLAEEWGYDQKSLEGIMKKSDLCDSPQEAWITEAEEKGKKDHGEKKEKGSGILSSILTLSKLILLVAALVLITFLTLITLMVLTMLSKDKQEQEEKKEEVPEKEKGAKK